MTTLEIYDADSLEFQVVVWLSNDDPANAPREIKRLDNATVEAKMRSGGVAISTVCEITDPAAGLVTIFYPEDTFRDRPGKYECHVRVREPGGRGQTVMVVRVNVRESA